MDSLLLIDDDIARRVQGAVDAGELHGVTAGPGAPKIAPLGAGESYTAWRIGSGDRARVLRIPRPPV